jgi:hypothetical protein
VRLQGEEQSKDGRTRVGEETNEGTKKVREREGKVSQADKDAKASWDESRSGKKKRIGLTSWEVGSSKGIQRGARGRQRGRVEREEDGSREVDSDGGGEMSEGGREARYIHLDLIVSSNMSQHTEASLYVVIHPRNSSLALWLNLQEPLLSPEISGLPAFFG